MSKQKTDMYRLNGGNKFQSVTCKFVFFSMYNDTDNFIAYKSFILKFNKG